MQQGETDRRPIEVAVGIVEDAEGRVLIGQRPEGKAYAGYWEFPGGKIEPGESVAQALARELNEELGLQTEACAPLLTLVHRYPEYTVRLHIRRVDRFSGEAWSREAQQLAWVPKQELHTWKLLQADGPVVQAICRPPDYVFTPPSGDAELLLAGVRRLPEGAMLRLRRPELNDIDYESLASKLLPLCQQRQLTLLLDRGAEMAVRIGAAGLHLDERALFSAPDRAQLPAGWIIAASVHDANGLRRAADCADVAVLGAVKETDSHPDRQPLGWSGFADLCEQARLPVYGIGGLSPSDMEQVRQCGGQGVAGISAYWSGR